MIADDPDDDLIPKLVTGLLAAPTARALGQHPGERFVLLAMDRYFNTYEICSALILCAFRWGETYAGGIRGLLHRTPRDQHPHGLSRGWGRPGNLILSKEGTGRLYYRLGLKYAPSTWISNRWI